MNLEDLDDYKLLALCVMGEARGEPLIGKLAVAHVVLNRAAKPGWWGTDVKSVLLKPWQFSCFNEDDPNRKRMNAWIEYPDGYPPMNTCLTIARLALQGLTIDPTGGATHYCRHDCHPDWVDKLTFLTQLSSHRFYA